MIHAYPEFIGKYPQTQKNKPLAPLTTLKVGGEADLFLELTETEQLPEIMQTADELQIPVFIFGGGSNIVFSEDGFRGLVIQLKASKIEIKGGEITAEAGAPVSLIIQTALQENLSGMENLTGLPGTIGGAVRGNAGAFGTEIKDILKEAVIYNETNGIHRVSKDYFNFGYRTSKVKQEKGRDIILKVTLTLTPKSPQELQQIKEKTAEIIKSRAGKQPSGKTSGSLFKNPGPELAAGYLLDQCGCKGLQMGRVQVSAQHANWIINLGDATQTDVMELAKIMKDKVKNRFNIDLEPEVQFVSASGYLDIP